MYAAHKATEQELAAMEKRLHDIYSRAQKELGETWKAYMDESGEKIEALQKEYEAAKKSGDQKEIRDAGRRLAAAKREQTIYDGHYRRLTEKLAKDISSVNERAFAYINGSLPKVYVSNYNAFAKDIQNRFSGISFELVDEHTIRRLMEKEENLLPLKKVDGKKDVRWNVQRINAEVTQGILQGESMDKIAKRMQNVLSMNENSAIRNARTAVTGSENKGRMDMLHDAREKGVFARKIWMAANDSRTRAAHAELDGKEAEEEEYFSNSIGEILYPGDPDADPANTYNCRCSLGYKVVGFERIGGG